MANPFLETLQKYVSIKKGVELNQDKIIEDLEQATQQVEIKKSHDYENRISVEIIAEPYTPDAHGHWYSAETVEKGFLSADKVWREGRFPMNLYHAYDDKDAEHVELIKHYLVPFDCEVNGQPVKEGSWIGEVKWKNETLWKQRTEVREDGTTAIAGLSLKGWGKINPPKKGD